MVVGRRECAVEKMSSWGITKLRADRDRVLDVSGGISGSMEAGRGQKSWCVFLVG